MGAIKTTADSVYRDYETVGVPASGPHPPVKSEIRDLFEDIENLLNNTIDVAWVIGQSNANNSSEGLTSSPTVPSGLALKYQSGALSNCNDPVGPGSITSGSAWPAFAIEYLLITGRRICVVPTGVGSSAMLAAANLGPGANYWASGGNAYPAAHAAYNAATAALVAAGYLIGKQFVIDIQGETDAVGVDAATAGVTAANFKTAKQALFTQIRGDLGIPSLPIYISLLGIPQTGSTAGFVAIRAKQSEIIAADYYTNPCFFGADLFTGRGMMQTGGNYLHYTQAAYNELGRDAGRRIATGDFVQRLEPLGAGPYVNVDNRIRNFLQVDDADLSFVTSRALGAGRMHYNSSSGMTINAKAGSGQDFAIFNPGGTGIAYTPTGTLDWYVGGGMALPTNRAFAAANWAYKDASNGIALVGKVGSVYDFSVLNPAGSAVFGVLTGTLNVAFLGNISASNFASVGGNVAAITFNNMSITTPASTTTLTIAAAKIVTFNNTITFTATDGATLAIGGGGTLGSNAYTSTAYAPLASPGLTGTPTAPTAAVDTSSTQIASTAFVLAQAASATPLINGTAAVGTSTRFARGDHVHPTDTTRAALVSPSFTTPSLGVATATTINGVTLDNNAWSTYTPTVTAATGTPTTVSATGRYKQIGKTVIAQMQITITSVGTASGGLNATLPVTAAAFAYAGSVFESSATGKSGAGFINGSATPTLLATRDASATSWWVNGYVLVVTITYEVP